MRPVVAVLLGSLAVAAAACSGPAAGDGRLDRDPPLILLVTVDSLRADAVAAADAPAFNRLRQRAHAFTNAYTACSWTKPAMASLLTSTLVSRHLVFLTTLDRAVVTSYLGARLATDRDAAYRRGNVLPSHLPVLPEQLAGYQRLAVAENVHLRRELGFARGWDEFETVADRKGEAGIPSNSDRVNAAALALVDRHRGANLLLWVHYFDVHWPFGPVDRYGAEILGPELAALPTPLTHAGLDALAAAGPDTRFARTTLPLLYRVGVRTFDDHLAALFAALDQRGLLDPGLVVVTADHGEELFEHGVLGHGHNLSDATVRVPLLVKLPGQRDAASHDGVVSLVDVAPTVLDLTRRPLPTSFQGRSLVPVLAARPAPPGAAISEVVSRSLHAYKAIMAGDRKLVVGPDESHEVLTALADDTFPLAADPTVAGDLRRRLLDAVGRWDLLDLLAAEPLDDGDQGIANEEEIRRQLEALGYL